MSTREPAVTPWRDTAPPLSQYVYVATIETRYEVMAVAYTEEEAIRLACLRAHKYVHAGDNGRHPYTYDDGIDPVTYFTEEFGVSVDRIKIGTAILVGCGEGDK